MRVLLLAAFVASIVACCVLSADGRLQAFSGSASRLARARAPQPEGGSCCSVGTCEKPASQCVVKIDNARAINTNGDGQAWCQPNLICCLRQNVPTKDLFEKQTGCTWDAKEQKPWQQYEKKQAAGPKLKSWGPVVDNSAFQKKVGKCKGGEPVLDGDSKSKAIDVVDNYKYPFAGGVPVGLDCCALAAMAHSSISRGTLGQSEFMLGVAIINGHFYFAVSTAGDDPKFTGPLEGLGLTNARKINTAVVQGVMDGLKAGWGCAAPWLVAASRLEQAKPTCMAEVLVTGKGAHAASDGKVIASCTDKCTPHLDTLFTQLQQK